MGTCELGWQGIVECKEERVRLVFGGEHAGFGAIGLRERMRAVFDFERNVWLNWTETLSAVGSFRLQVRVEGSDDRSFLFKSTFKKSGVYECTNFTCLIDDFSHSEIFVYDEDLFQRLSLGSDHGNVHFRWWEMIIVPFQKMAKLASKADESSTPCSPAIRLST